MQLKINNLILFPQFFLPLAPYVNYIRKDPGAPCSLTEALEYLQVDILEDLITKEAADQRQPPKNKPHNFTVVAMEGCHSFIILDWARPLKDDMVSGKKMFTHVCFLFEKFKISKNTHKKVKGIQMLFQLLVSRTVHLFWFKI